MKIICLDAGNGGKDPGASYGGVAEKDIALKVVKLIGEALENRALVYYTRTGDTYPELSERCRRANSVKADLFVSIHCNSAANAQATGFEVWTSNGQTKSDPIATKIYNSVKDVFPGAKYRSDMSDGDPDKEADYYVLCNTTMPAVLVELGFISNAVDRANLTNSVWQRKMAQTIAAAIV